MNYLVIYLPPFCAYFLKYYFPIAMDDKIRKTLHALNLNIDLDTIDSVVEFLNSEIGPVD